ncbi:MAG: diphthine--ammonia ligase [Chitinophagaceae bacterium]
MQNGKRIGCSWSGGKDSCYALITAAEQGAIPAVLVNMMNENGKISRSHGLPFSLLQKQAEAMELPILAFPTSWNDYEDNFVNALLEIKSKHGVETMVFGDVDLQEHRDWEEKVCLNAGIEAMLPLWQYERKALLLEMLNKGMKAMIVSCNPVLGEAFLGRVMDYDIIPELEERGVDVCGENGEFHTVVIDCPLFKRSVDLPRYSKTEHGGYYFLQWEV